MQVTVTVLVMVVILSSSHRFVSPTGKNDNSRILHYLLAIL